MYDPLKTKLSERYLKKIIEHCPDTAIMGGWATYFHVNKEYRRAFGTEYLKSRDIDIFVTRDSERQVKEAIDKLGFKQSAYQFRYELIYDREHEKIVTEEDASDTPMHNLFYIFLDVFSSQELEIGSWKMDDREIQTTEINGIPVIDIQTLIDMKCTSLFEREKLNKEYKDACDLYALINYSGRDIKRTKKLEKAVEKIKKRDDLVEFVAENVLQDSLKTSIVKNQLNNLLS